MSSLDWLQKARSSVNRRSDFRNLGSADIEVAFSAGKKHQIVTFEAFSVGNIHDVDRESDLLDVGVKISMTEKQWNFYLRRRHAGKAPSLVAFGLDSNVLKFNSPTDRLDFLRVHKSIQAFVDAGARYATR